MTPILLCSPSYPQAPVNYRIQKPKLKPSSSSSSLSYSKRLTENFQKKSSFFNRKTRPNLESASFLEKFKEKYNLNLVQILKEGGSWSNEQFWDIVSYLRQSSRSTEIPKVFEIWKIMEKSGINEENYSKIITILIEEGLVEAAATVLGEMKHNGLRLSPEIYVSIIHGFAKNGRFNDAVFHLKEMEEDLGFIPDTEIYDGLIQAYGDYKMYDEMSRCVKEMESKGFQSDYITYNLLIREFARAGLLNKMESIYHSLPYRRMNLQGSTLIAMVKAYARFGILDKMEKIYKRYLKSRSDLEEDLIRNIAGVYIENNMFSRLEDLGLNLSSKKGNTELVWCLRILSHACLLSRKGMYSIFEEMESRGVPWNATVTNTLALAYMKMKDFKQLKMLLLELPSRNAKPDIITIGILFDACLLGFDGKSVKSTWKKVGFFDHAVEMRTDFLVLAAFGKGHFLTSCEQMHRSLETNGKMKQVCTYSHLINLISLQQRLRFNTKIGAEVGNMPSTASKANMWTS